VKLRKIQFALLIAVIGLPGTSALHAQQNATAVPKNATSIEVGMIGFDKVSVPKGFQVALYENLMRKLDKSGDFHMVYRDGNKNAQTNDNLVMMQSTITAFKEGSERARQVTTVKGATKIMVHCEFTDKQGTVLLQRDIEGKVRFFGNNLKATEDFAKKAAKAADEALAIYRVKQEPRAGA
jgi:hypothetical protein